MIVTKELFLSKFIDQLEGYEGDPIDLQTQFRSLDVWDSLTGVAVQIMISDDFGAAIPDDDFVNAKSIGDLFELTQKYQE